MIDVGGNAGRSAANPGAGGRSAFPARSTWADWLADHGPTDPTSQQISRLQGLEAAGATLFIQAVDVSDQVAMQAVIAEVRRRFGAIHGVIHAAGIGGANLIAQRNDAALAAVLAPKVQGTLVLEALLHDQPLDFFVLCSSLSAFLRWGRSPIRQPMPSKMPLPKVVPSAIPVSRQFGMPGAR